MLSKTRDNCSTCIMLSDTSHSHIQWPLPNALRLYADPYHTWICLTVNITMMVEGCNCTTIEKQENLHLTGYIEITIMHIETEWVFNHYSCTIIIM